MAHVHELFGDRIVGNTRRRGAIQAADAELISILPLHVNLHSFAFLHIWGRMAGQNGTNGLLSFYWSRPREKPITPIEFLEEFKPGTGRVLLAIMKEEEIIGAGILHDFNGLHRVCGGIWIEPKYRGKGSEIIGKRFLAYVHGELKFKYLFAMSPWWSAKQFMLRCGMYATGELPGYYKHGDKVLDVEIFCSEKR